MTDIQKTIASYLRHGRYSLTTNLDDQLSLFNEQCLIGMVETGEATITDMQVVGGAVLASRIAKGMTRTP